MASRTRIRRTAGSRFNVENSREMRIETIAAAATGGLRYELEERPSNAVLATHGVQLAWLAYQFAV
jgi:hypothetical protein